jgi:hypothetical protein
VDFDQWVKLLGALGAFATVGFAVVVTVHKALDRRSDGHRRAEEALGLLKSWSEINLEDQDPQTVRAGQRHREELLNRAFSATQTYLYATQPTFVSQWQTLIVGLGGAFSTFWLLVKPLTGSYDEVSVITALVVGLAAWIITHFTFSRVSFYKADANALRKAGSRAVPTRKVRGKKQRRQGASRAVTAEERH